MSGQQWYEAAAADVHAAASLLSVPWLYMYRANVYMLGLCITGIMRAATGFEPSDKWFGQQAVYRISMGNFLFFGCMSLALLGVKYKGEKRGQVLQHGNWMIKLVVWVLFNALPFLFPNGLVQAYGAQ